MHKGICNIRLLPLPLPPTYIALHALHWLSSAVVKQLVSGHYKILNLYYGNESSRKVHFSLVFKKVIYHSNEKQTVFWTAFSIHWIYWVLSTPLKDENHSFQFKGFFCYTSQLPCPEIVISSTECRDWALSEICLYQKKKIQINQTRKILICVLIARDTNDCSCCSLLLRCSISNPEYQHA